MTRNTLAEAIEAWRGLSVDERHRVRSNMIGLIGAKYSGLTRIVDVAERLLRAAAEPEAKDWDPFGPDEQIPEDIRRDTVTEKGWRR